MECLKEMGEGEKIMMFSLAIHFIVQSEVIGLGLRVKMKPFIYLLFSCIIRITSVLFRGRFYLNNCCKKWKFNLE